MWTSRRRSRPIDDSRSKRSRKKIRWIHCSTQLAQRIEDEDHEDRQDRVQVRGLELLEEHLGEQFERLDAILAILVIFVFDPLRGARAEQWIQRIFFRDRFKISNRQWPCSAAGAHPAIEELGGTVIAALDVAADDGRRALRPRSRRARASIASPPRRARGRHREGAARSPQSRTARLEEVEREAREHHARGERVPASDEALPRCSARSARRRRRPRRGARSHRPARPLRRIASVTPSRPEGIALIGGARHQHGDRELARLRANGRSAIASAPSLGRMRRPGPSRAENPQPARPIKGAAQLSPDPSADVVLNTTPRASSSASSSKRSTAWMALLLESRAPSRAVRPTSTLSSCVPSRSSRPSRYDLEIDVMSPQSVAPARVHQSQAAPAGADRRLWQRPRRR